MREFLKQKAKTSLRRLVATCADKIAGEIVSGSLQVNTVLTEFPKSGGSFLCFVLNHLLENRDQLCVPNPHIYSCLRSSLDLDQSTSSLAMVSGLMEINTKHGCRVLKTHAHHEPRFRSIICLYREPLSVMTSDYRHLMANGCGDYQHLNQLITCKQRGMPAWLDFYRSYAAAPKDSRIYFLNYAELCSHPVQAIEHALLGVFGLALNGAGKERVSMISGISYGQDLEDIVISHDPRMCFEHRFIRSQASIGHSLAEVRIPTDLSIQCETMMDWLNGSSTVIRETASERNAKEPCYGSRLEQ